MIVTICGSHKFDKQIMKCYELLTMKGHCVFLPAFLDLYKSAAEAENDIPGGVVTPVMDMLRRVHRDKMDLSEAIYVVNCDGYVGKDTQAEIDYARQHSLDVYYFMNPSNVDLNPNDIWNQ